MRNLIFTLCLLLTASVAIADSSLPIPKSVLVNGTTLHYIDTGEPVTNINSKPVLFVHGSLGDFRTWKAQISAISRDRRVIAISRRYHHPNPWPENQTKGFSASIHADDLVSLIKTLDLGRLDLVGHSFGAVVALLVARDHGELIETLTIAEPPVSSIIGSPSERKTIRNFVKTVIIPASNNLANGEDEEGIRHFVNGVLGGDMFDNLAPELKTVMMDNVLSLKGELMEGSIIPPFTCMEARNIDIPILIVDGENTIPMYRVIVDKLKECLPNESHMTIPNASHGMVFTNPDAFNDLLTSFLDRNR